MQWIINREINFTEKGERNREKSIYSKIFSVKSISRNFQKRLNFCFWNFITLFFVRKNVDTFLREILTTSSNIMRKTTRKNFVVQKVQISADTFYTSQWAQIWNLNKKSNFSEIVLFVFSLFFQTEQS